MEIPPSLCIECRGTKYLCGLAYCPIMVKCRLEPLANIPSDIVGSTPPSIFVGRIGYPKVLIGPMLPPVKSDTSLYDTPELWADYRIDDILHFRLSLVRGTTPVNVHDASNPNNTLQRFQEVAIADRSIKSEMIVEKLENSVHISEHIPPFGPSGHLVNFKPEGNISIDDRIEKAYYDRDLKASNAIIKLYEDKVPLSRIMKALSVGTLGRKRRLVPTRWSITAVDDTVSKALVEQIKMHQEIGEYLVYIRKVSMNTFVTILIPGSWEFEWIEAWFPNTTWNMLQYGEPELMGDSEGYMGIDHYARVGGCYYSARLAAAETLSNMKRQSSVLMLREIYPGFNLPIGVWFVREQLRAMFRSKAARFSNLDDAITYAMKNLTIPLRRWREKSRLLQSIAYQKRISDYI